MYNHLNEPQIELNWIRDNEVLKIDFEKEEEFVHSGN